jgi:hypothetical protein
VGGRQRSIPPRAAGGLAAGDERSLTSGLFGGEQVEMSSGPFPVHAAAALSDLQVRAAEFDFRVPPFSLRRVPSHELLAGEGPS